MKGRIVTVAIVFVMSTLAITPNAGESAAQPGASQAGKAHQAVSMTLRTQSAPTPGDDLKNSPIMFVENAGQWDEGARFQALGGPAGTMWLAEDAIWITVAEEGGSEVRGSEHQRADRSMERLPDLRPATSGAPRRGANIKLSFVGANLHPQIEPFERLATRVSYFIGNNPDQWRPEVPVWRGARYVDLYPGVDLELTSEAGQMVSRLAARPGADLDAVRLHIEGADAVAVVGDALRLSTAAGEFTLPLLRMDGWLGTGSQVEPSGAQAFDVAAPFAPANSNRPSAIENWLSPADNPADLLYGTFLGGSDYDTGNAVAVDGAGSAYVTGTTYSPDFPTTPGAFDPSHNGEYDAFVVKLNPTGSGLVYATFLGGSNYDMGYRHRRGQCGQRLRDRPDLPSRFPHHARRLRHEPQRLRRRLHGQAEPGRQRAGLFHLSRRQ